MAQIPAILREWMSSLRRLAKGPATLERTLTLTLGGLVLAAILALSLTAVGLLRKQAEQQAISQVRYAGVAAREELRRLGEDTVTTARVLAGRQPLQRLIRAGNRTQTELFLRRTCSSLGLEACAVFAGPDVIASIGDGVAWDETLEASADQGERFMLAPQWQPDGLIGAIGVVPNYVDTRVVTLRYLDVDIAEKLSEQTGMPIRFVRLSNWLDEIEPDFKELHSTALSRAETVALRIKARDLFASSTPIFAATGEGITLLEARQPASASDSAVAGFVRRLGWIAFLLSLGAVAAALLLARRIVSPLQSVADSATRLGRGDFSTSIPASSGAPEVDGLARTLEEMRRHLVDLTATLRRSEADARAVLTGIVEGVYAVDANRNVKYMNPQAGRMLGTDSAQAVGRFCGDVLSPCALADGRRPCETACPIVASRESGQAQATEVLSRADGSQRTIIITSAGMVDGLQVQVMRDETDLEAARRARDSILANISHEFRTPLAAQIASIELLQENLHDLSREQLEELVTSLRRGSLRLTRLIDNLLESVRIESGQLAIRHQHVQVNELVQDAVELVGSLFPQRGQFLVVDVPEGMPSLVGDAPRLTQVLVNLLANANKFGPEGSTVTLRARHDQEAVELTVEDEGPGVTESDRASIFDRFQRATGEEPEPRGLGLGLWIVKSIVERHGGTVATPHDPSGPTRFVVRLPLAGGTPA